jgi:hypothetical protein
MQLICKRLNDSKLQDKLPKKDSLQLKIFDIADKKTRFGMDNLTDSFY